MDTVKEHIKTAYKGSKKLRIEGYVTSKGDVIDYIVEIVGYEGYRSMLQQSFDFISNLKRPEGFNAADWSEASLQQLASWNNSLNGVTQRESKVELKPVDGAGYSVRADRPEAIVLTHLRKVDSQFVNGESTKASSYRDGVTAAKAWMRDNAPVSQYINMLILEPGKFTSVTAV